MTYRRLCHDRIDTLDQHTLEHRPILRIDLGNSQIVNLQLSSHGDFHNAIRNGFRSRRTRRRHESHARRRAIAIFFLQGRHAFFFCPAEVTTDEHVAECFFGVVWFGYELVADACSNSVDHVICWRFDGGRSGRWRSRKFGWISCWIFRRIFRWRGSWLLRHLQINHLIRTPIPHGTLTTHIILSTTRHGRTKLHVFIAIPLLGIIGGIGTSRLFFFIGMPNIAVALAFEQ
mmetsp:Transcript_15088/g.27406  ORF Transcript_15088/g.27406 Transcript_15088/m.27406 type:complete len:231 (-) Transcript_15088:461-1153(-)